MVFADFQAKQRQNKQSAIVREYFSKRNGQALCLSDDQTFVALLRNSIRALGVSRGGLLTIVPDASKLIRYLTESFTEYTMPVLFIERVLTETGDTSLLIRQCKDSFPELRVMVMTTTADRGRLMLLHESGADNFIVKPISGVELIEKMAVTLKPPGVVRMLLDKARSFIVKNIGKEALKISAKVLEVKPDSASGYVVMGDALRISGERAKAQMAYERACKYSSDYMEPLQRLVDLAREDGKKDMQLEYLKRLDELSPLNAQRKVEMGRLLVDMGNTEAATQLFDTAISRVYKDAMAQVAAMTEKIAVSLQDSDPVQAEKYLRRCLEIKGKDLTVDDLTTFNQLGISLRRQGRWEDAITEYKRALKIAPKSEGLFYNIALAYGDGKDFETAARSMLKALSLNPNLPRSSPAIAYNMGVIFSHGGYTQDKALQCLEIALELDPDFEPAKNALEKIRKSMEEQNSSPV